MTLPSAVDKRGITSEMIDYGGGGKTELLAPYRRQSVFEVRDEIKYSRSLD